MNKIIKNAILKITQATDCREVEIIQTLWSGYGKIARYQLFGSYLQSVVVKSISLDQQSNHPRGWNTDFSHQRKVKSYQVEMEWYNSWNQKCSSYCRTPLFLGLYTFENNHLIVMEDLANDFPAIKEHATIFDVKTCLQWLAYFHANNINSEPKGLWETGTYWHLKTRPDEYKKIKNRILKSKALLIDEKLNHCQYQTIVHGDAKLANFCFSTDGKKVAAVDFQYVGGGCGIKDVVYFLGSCLSSSECQTYENELLDFYFSELNIAIQVSKIRVDFEALEAEWRALYPFAWTDFTRFLLGWMPTHHKINNYSVKLMNSVLKNL